MRNDEKTIEAINCKAGEEGSGNLVHPIESENELAWMIVDVCVDYIKRGDKPGAVRATSKFLKSIQPSPPDDDECLICGSVSCIDKNTPDNDLVVDILASITWESNGRHLNWEKTEEKIRKLLQGKK